MFLVICLRLEDGGSGAQIGGSFILANKSLVDFNERISFLVEVMFCVVVQRTHCILSFRRPQESQLPLHFSASCVRDDGSLSDYATHSTFLALWVPCKLLSVKKWRGFLAILTWASARTAWRFALEPVWRATVALKNEGPAVRSGTAPYGKTCPTLRAVVKLTHLRDFVRSVAALQASEAGPKAIVVITSF